MTCKDCIKNDVCELYVHLHDAQDVEKRCKHFKNKADLQEALENVVWYHAHYEWLEPLADELEKATGNFGYPADAYGWESENHFIWMLLVGMFGNWGTSVGGGWIEQTKECAQYIRTLCAKAKGEEEYDECAQPLL